MLTHHAGLNCHHCDHCGISFSNKSDLEDHVQANHVNFEPITPTNNLAPVQKEQFDFSKMLNNLKDSLLAQLTTIQKNQDSMKEAIAQMIKVQETSNLSINHLGDAHNRIEATVTEVTKTVTNLSNHLSVPRQACPPRPISTSPPSQTSSMPHQYRASESLFISEDIRKVTPPSQPSHPQPWNPSPLTSGHQSIKPLTPPSRRLPTSERRKVRYITDSIGSIADIRHIEEATNTLIYSEKAFGAQYKADAFKPNNNFIQASMKTHTKNDFSYVVLQGSSTDVTNLDTSNVNNGSMEYFKQEILIASRNMISAARNIILRNPAVEKVIVLERPPRFDPPSLDPFRMKNQISKFGNEALHDALEHCDVKDKIVISNHSLPDSFQHNLYGHPDSIAFDGIHFNGIDGRNHYTRSLCNILQKQLYKHAREPHNHRIPQTLGSVIASPSSNVSPTTPPTLPAKPDTVIIDIEDETMTENIKYIYIQSLPTILILFWETKST